MQEKKSHPALWFILGTVATALIGDLNDGLKNILPNVLKSIHISGFGIHLDLTLIIAIVLTFALMCVSFFLGSAYPFVLLFGGIFRRQKKPMPLLMRISFIAGAVLYRPATWIYQWRQSKKPVTPESELSPLQKKMRALTQEAAQKGWQEVLKEEQEKKNTPPLMQQAQVSSKPAEK